MASRYVPPQLRARSGSKQDESDSAASATTNVNSTLLPRRPLGDLTFSSGDDDGGHSMDEIAAHYNDDQLRLNLKASTFRCSATKPRELVYILLFQGANPRWESDQIIFAKTNIHILPGYSVFKTSMNGENTTDQAEGAAETMTAVEKPFLGASNEHRPTSTNETPAKSSLETLASGEDLSSIKELTQGQNVKDDTPPHIPVFCEQSNRRFTFTGFFQILNIEFLAPGSAALIRMLEQKWALTHNSARSDAYSQRSGTRQRNPEKWAESLSLEWAVVKMEKVEKSGLEEPKIGKIEVA